jgi:hypothetical protein
MFKWISDEDGDIGLQMLWGLFTFIKYKHGGYVQWFRRYNQPASKWQGCDYDNKGE